MTDAEYDYLFRDADPRWKAYYRMQREEYRKTHPRTNFEKCAKCGRVLEGENLALSRIILTEEPPPENLFAEEGEK